LKDKETTSAELGYKITGYNISEPGKSDEKFLKIPYKNVAETGAVIDKILNGKPKHA